MLPLSEQWEYRGEKMKILKQSFMITVIFLILCGFIYPVAIRGIGVLFFKNKAEGSLVTYNGEVVGSRLIGQEFKSPEFFHGRISAVNYSTGEDKNLSPKLKSSCEIFSCILCLLRMLFISFMNLLIFSLFQVDSLDFLR